MKTIVLVFFLLISIGLQGSQAQNLIANPYFTAGFSGWSGTYGIIGNGSVNPKPQYGNSTCIVLSSEPAMYQFFTTTIGATYQVTWNVRLPDFDSQGIPIQGPAYPGPAQLTVDLNGQFTNYLIQNRTNWLSFTEDFVATGTSTELLFEIPQYVNGHPSDDVFMDYVSAVAVPEPSTWSLLLVALATFIGRKGLRRHLGVQKVQRGTQPNRCCPTAV